MINTRIATPDDRDGIELLTRLLVSDKKEKFKMKRFEWGLLRRLYDRIQRHGIFIAEEIENGNETNKKIVGMVFSELRVDPFGDSEAYIKQFYVRKSHRKQGIGKLLLHAVIHHLSKMDIQHISVRVKPTEEAVEALKLYSKLNFKKKYTVMKLSVEDVDLDNLDISQKTKRSDDPADKNECAE